MKKRSEKLKSKIVELLIDDNQDVPQKHFYILSISIQPTRETYHKFSFDSLKKAGRNLINGLSTLSSLSNRAWWSMYVDGGIRYYLIKQINEDEFPFFTLDIIFFSSRDNLDVLMNIQVKHRLFKICPKCSYNLKYLGNQNKERLLEIIQPELHINLNNNYLQKLNPSVIKEITKIIEQKPISFGSIYLKQNLSTRF